MKALIAKIVLLSFCVATLAIAEETLSNEALFYRCYGQLTQNRPGPNDPLLAEVIAGTKTPVQACMAVFDSARFTANGNTTIADTSDPVALSVLNTFHKLHASWFKSRDFTAAGQSGQLLGLQDIYDIEAPAFYFDKVLFTPNAEFDTIVTGTQTFRAVRTTMDPQTGFMTNSAKTGFAFGAGFQMAATGTLQGVQPMPLMNVSYSFVKDGGQTATGSVSLGKNFGGGILGSNPYLMLNMDEVSTFSADGSVKMPRKWARAVFSDLMCRSLPVIRWDDGKDFVSNLAEAPFRQSANCTQCHASMDRMAASIRNAYHINIGTNALTGRGGNFINFMTALSVLPTTAYNDAVWSIKPLPTRSAPLFGDEFPSGTPPTNAYNQTYPDGVLYYRNINGYLVNASFRGLAQLGDKIATFPDIYMCAAKRYYSYFMGVDVPMTDDISHTDLTGTDKRHRDNVISLGLSLMNGTAANGNTDKKLVRELVRKILSLNDYKKSSFGAER